MFGITRIKIELQELKNEVERRLPSALNRVQDLEEEVRALKIELKYPAFFREGQAVGPYSVVEILKIGEYDEDRPYKVLDRERGTMHILFQASLFIWDTKK